jgi:ATP-dependent helicase/nuclease subunit B
MPTPRIRFLDKPSSLAVQVAEALLVGVEGHPCDLSAHVVWVPTSGAARRIRHQLAELSSRRGGGVLSPRFFSPMRALLPKGALATRGDREAAWGLVLQKADPSKTQHLFPKPEVLQGESSILGSAGMMCDLCDLLAEGGVTPMDRKVIEVCYEDEERWAEIAPLYRGYLDVLNREKLWDPNEARIKAWEEPVEAIASLTIACIPDLTEAAKKKAETILEAGIPVTVLVWKPDAASGWGGGFDAWGRPDAHEWIDAEISLSSDQIRMAKDPEHEASQALDFLSEAEGDHALVMGDENLAPAFRAEVLSRGGSPFLPEGEILSKTEPGVMAVEWIRFRREKGLRTLRRLLELPRFTAWIGEKCGLSHEELLRACDAMNLELLAEILPEVPLPSVGIGDRSLRESAEKLVAVLRSVFGKSARELITEIWRQDPAEEVLEAFEESSQIFTSWPDPDQAREAMFSRTLTRQQSFGSSQPGDLELFGWLEAPWVEARRLALCGCVEGRLPSSSDGHPFLPDQKRAALGIPDNAVRRARDAYLLGCLTRSRAPGEFRCSFSKFGPDGSPSLPSSLLMRCAPEELPQRVIMLFEKPPGEGVLPVREHDWKWRIPSKQNPLQKLNVTDFKGYLSCPFRFYLRKFLKLQDHDPDRREMDALQFGDLIHKVLEQFGKEASMLTDREDITSYVLSRLESEIRARFGADPSPAVRVQIEAARVRLLSFAKVQTELAAEGWRIIETEFEASASLVLDGISISAKIDRIDMKGDLIRVLDYKTQTSVKDPDKAHLGSVSKAFFKEASATIKGCPKAWADLQLPLYRKIAETLYPGKTIETAYFVLAADPEESKVSPFKLDDSLQDSALACTEAVASRIARGVFWPPQQLPESWEDSLGIFLSGGSPEECLDAESIAFLKGNDETVGKEERP